MDLPKPAREEWREREKSFSDGEDEAQIAVQILARK